MRLKSELPSALKYQAVVTESAAREAGLDFYDVVFEILDAADVNGVAAYGGFPVRYPSWRFGMEYERLEKGRQWGLSKIYELVINNDPTYAYLVRSNSLLEQKLVMAHVYGHADFFRHNLWFAPTNRKMLDAMGEHAVRIRRYVDLLGQEAVEGFLDIALSIDTLIDPYLPLREHSNPPETRTVAASASERARRALDALSLSVVRAEEPSEVREGRRADLPTYDTLGFLAQFAPLEGWQQDILEIVREEAYYFAPQRMTKIMNEGWASFWHSRLLTGGLLDDSEILDFADCHSGATSCPPGQLNPYKIGLELYRHAESIGEDLFQLRRIHNDVSFIHKLVDEGFTERVLRPILAPTAPAGPPAAGPLVGGSGGQEEPSWQDIKARVLRDISWGGQPQIELQGVDLGGEGELLFVHHHDGRDLKLGAAEATLLQIGRLWKRPVRLRTTVDGAEKWLVVREGRGSLVDVEKDAGDGSVPASDLRGTG